MKKMARYGYARPSSARVMIKIVSCVKAMAVIPILCLMSLITLPNGNAATTTVLIYRAPIITVRLLGFVRAYKEWIWALPKIRSEERRVGKEGDCGRAT